jgi:hypothetical protein
VLIRARKSAAVVAAAMVLMSAGPAEASINPIDMTVFAFGPTFDYIAEWNMTTDTWTQIGPGNDGLSVGGAGIFSWTEHCCDISEYDGTPGQWTVIGGPGEQFVQAGGHLYGVGVNNAYVAEWNGSGQNWTRIGGPAGTLVAGGFGLFATDPTGSDLYRYDGTPGQWTEVESGNIVGNFAVGPTALYGVDFSNGPGLVLQWTGSGTAWTTIGDVPANQLIAGGSGLYETAWSTGDVERYDGTPGQWTVIGGPGSDFVSSETGFYAIGPLLVPTSDDYIAEWLGQPGQWKVIGGDSQGLVAG